MLGFFLSGYKLLVHCVMYCYVLRHKEGPETRL